MNQLTVSFTQLLDPFAGCFRPEVFSTFCCMTAAWVAPADGAAEVPGAALGAQADASRASPVTKAMARQEIAFKERPPLPAARGRPVV